MKAVAVSLFLLAVLMVFAAAKGVASSDNWAECIEAVLPAVVVVYMFLRVARECREIERAERERAFESRL